MEDRERVDPIEHATALLSTLLHCRKQSLALRACRRDPDRLHPCDAEEAAFVTCSKANIGLVVQHLVKIADKNCPREIAELQRCRTQRPGDDCEYEDMAAMRCAALRVLAAAAAPKAAG